MTFLLQFSGNRTSGELIDRRKRQCRQKTGAGLAFVPENAVAELRRELPANLATKIDFSTLTVLSSHFVDDDLQDCESDLLFSATLNEAEALIYVLVEHQSTVDWNMPFRLLRYMANAWEQYVKAHVGARKVPTTHSSSS